MVAIKPCSTCLGIKTSHNQYILFTPSKLNSCDIIKRNCYICSNAQIRHIYGSQMCECEINLYHNKTTPTCTIENSTSKWIALHRRNQWIYATSSSSRATAVCNRDIFNLSLKGSGLLTLHPECVLKHEFVTMSGQQTISTTIRSSYTSLGKLSDLSVKEYHPQSLSNNQSSLVSLDNEYAKNIRELSTLQKSVKEQQLLDLPNRLRSHQQHNHAVGYLALSLSLLTLVILLGRCKDRCKAIKPTPTEIIQESIELQGNTQTPTPMPRQQVHRFILDV